MDKKRKIMYGTVLFAAVFIILFFWEKKDVWKNEEGNLLMAENVFCGEWKVLFSESVENESKGYMQEGDIIIIREDEITIDDEVLANICFDGTLATNLEGQEYDDFFKEYGYRCSCFEWIQKNDFYLYVMAFNVNQRMVFCMSEANHMIIRYRESVYFCEKNSKKWEDTDCHSAGICRMHDFGLDGGETFEGKWMIDRILAIKEKKQLSENDNLTGEEIYFYRSDLGKIRMQYNEKMYRKIAAKMDVVAGQEEQVFDGYGSFEELELNNSLVPYVQLDLSKTDVKQIQGFFVISDEEIILVTEKAMYICVR